MIFNHLDLNQNTKRIIEETVSWDVTTTLIGETHFNKYQSSADTAKAIRRIQKIVEDASASPTVTTISFPETNLFWDPWFNHIWDDRATLDYI